MNTSTAIKKLTQARNIIDEMGWCRGVYTDRQGHHCIYGALRVVEWDHCQELANLLIDDIEQLPSGGLAAWNDHKNRRKRGRYPPLRPDHSTTQDKGSDRMSTVLSLLLLASGAILRYAVDSDLWAHLNEDTVGMILMVIGAVGLLFSLLIAALVGKTALAIRELHEEPLGTRIRKIR